jgi:uracil-DNA glycosylase
LENQLNGHNKTIEDMIISRYIELREKIGGCSACKPYLSDDINEGRPVSFYVIGEDFPKQTTRVMFVGKTVTYGWETSPAIPGSDFIDSREYAKASLFLPHVNNWVLGSPFWEAVKAVSQVIWKDNTLDQIWRKIAITNLVKCSASKKDDETPPEMKRNCIETMRFFENEVIFAKPTHLIVFSGGDSEKYYDQYLSDLSFGFKTKPKQINQRNHCDYGVSWWHQEFLEMSIAKMHMLRTYHPSSRRSPKDQQSFCNGIAKWVKDNPVQL